MLFSHRRGLRPFEKAIQSDTLDKELRYGLWSCFHVCYLKQHNGVYGRISQSNLEGLFVQYWHNFFKLPIDNLDLRDIEGPAKFVRDWFLKAEWFVVYDFLEFTIKNGPEWFADDFRSMTNEVLTRENSAYRIVDKEITEITSHEEIEAVESAISDTSSLSGVQAHLKQALHHLSDRRHPDYRNSIKEAISAVEGVCQFVSGDNSATLGEALGVLEGKKQLHPALKQAFSKLYGYTSDADGIRHSMLEESTLSFSDTKFMLVACSGFINYVLGRCAEDGIKMTK
jgi:hypothetical protein